MVPEEQAVCVGLVSVIVAGTSSEDVLFEANLIKQSLAKLFADEIIVAAFALSFIFEYNGKAIPARVKSAPAVIYSSIRVKPLLFALFFWRHLMMS